MVPGAGPRIRDGRLTINKRCCCEEEQADGVAGQVKTGDGGIAKPCTLDSGARLTLQCMSISSPGSTADQEPNQAAKPPPPPPEITPAMHPRNKPRHRLPPAPQQKPVLLCAGRLCSGNSRQSLARQGSTDASLWTDHGPFGWMLGSFVWPVMALKPCQRTSPPPMLLATGTWTELCNALPPQPGLKLHSVAAGRSKMLWIDRSAASRLLPLLAGSQPDDLPVRHHQLG